MIKCVKIKRVLKGDTDVKGDSCGGRAVSEVPADGFVINFDDSNSDILFVRDTDLDNAVEARVLRLKAIPVTAVSWEGK